MANLKIARRFFLWMFFGSNYLKKNRFERRTFWSKITKLWFVHNAIQIPGQRCLMFGGFSINTLVWSCQEEWPSGSVGIGFS